MTVVYASKGGALREPRQRRYTTAPGWVRFLTGVNCGYLTPLSLGRLDGSRPHCSCADSPIDSSFDGLVSIQTYEDPVFPFSSEINFPGSCGFKFPSRAHVLRCDMWFESYLFFQ